MQELLSVGPGSLARFLERWYGPALNPEPNVADDIPHPLANWYRLAGSRGVQLVHQNQMLDPAMFRREEDKVVFYVENQGTWLWAYDTSSDKDPLVFDREAEPERQWRSTTERLSEFLLHVAVFEAILGCAVGAAAIDCRRSELELVLAPLAPVALPAWQWPGPDHRLYCGADLLAMAGPMDDPTAPTNDVDLFEVFLAAASEEAIAYTDGMPIRWEHNSRLESR